MPTQLTKEEIERLEQLNKMAEEAGKLADEIHDIIMGYLSPGLPRIFKKIRRKWYILKAYFKLFWIDLKEQLCKIFKGKYDF